MSVEWSPDQDDADQKQQLEWQLQSHRQPLGVASLLELAVTEEWNPGDGNRTLLMLVERLGLRPVMVSAEEADADVRSNDTSNLEANAGDATSPAAPVHTGKVVITMVATLPGWLTAAHCTGLAQYKPKRDLGNKPVESDLDSLDADVAGPSKHGSSSASSSAWAQYDIRLPVAASACRLLVQLLWEPLIRSAVECMHSASKDASLEDAIAVLPYALHNVIGDQVCGSAT